MKEKIDNIVSSLARENSNLESHTVVFSKDVYDELQKLAKKANVSISKMLNAILIETLFND